MHEKEQASIQFQFSRTMKRTFIFILTCAVFINKSNGESLGFNWAFDEDPDYPYIAKGCSLSD